PRPGCCGRRNGPPRDAVPAPWPSAPTTAVGRGRRRWRAASPPAAPAACTGWRCELRRALVTGGAGLIGSHLADRLLTEGWAVRILDNLEPQTHGSGIPAWINPGAEFVLGDVRDPVTLAAALAGVDTVFHLAAYGGYMPEIARFVDVNSLGTARLLETIRDRRPA